MNKFNNPELSVVRNYVAPSRVHPPTVNASDDSELIQSVFASDPVTGWPSSDAAYILSRDSNPVIADYVSRNLMQSHRSSSLGDDKDFALFSIKGKYESVSDYASRLKSKLTPSEE